MYLVSIVVIILVLALALIAVNSHLWMIRIVNELMNRNLKNNPTRREP